MSEDILCRLAVRGVETLRRDDPILAACLDREYRRQEHTLALVASCSVTHPSVLACEGAIASNVTAEGFPGARFHAGCEVVDEFETLAIDRAKAAFGAQYANVQPHSASTANQIVMASVLKPGDTLLGMDLIAGGHLSHGAKVNISGRYFNAIGYGLDQDQRIDYDRVEQLAKEHRPKLVICGSTAYPRAIDFERFRRIADDVGAFLLADITHIAGLVVGRQHINPIDIAHFTTCCTHKQLFGPRGGLILMGRDHQNPAADGRGTLAAAVQRSTFPLLQGAPLVNAIVAKARGLGRALSPEFNDLAARIVLLAKAFSAAFMARGVPVVSGGTDTHIVVLDVSVGFGITGIVAQRALERCNIVVNKNAVPGETAKATVTSGIRIGTNSIAARGLGVPEAERCTDLIVRVLRRVSDADGDERALSDAFCSEVRSEVAELCAGFPLVDYPVSNTNTAVGRGVSVSADG